MNSQHTIEYTHECYQAVEFVSCFFLEVVFLDAAFLPEDVRLPAVPVADDERFTAAVLPFFAAMNTSFHKELTNDRYNTYCKAIEGEKLEFPLPDDHKHCADADIAYDGRRDHARQIRSCQACSDRFACSVADL